MRSKSGILTENRSGWHVCEFRNRNLMSPLWFVNTRRFWEFVGRPQIDKLGGARNGAKQFCSFTLAAFPFSFSWVGNEQNDSQPESSAYHSKMALVFQKPKLQSCKLIWFAWRGSSNTWKLVREFSSKKSKFSPWGSVFISGLSDHARKLRSGARGVKRQS